LNSQQEHMLVLAQALWALETELMWAFEMELLLGLM
jgi:hypothetical protein